MYLALEEDLTLKTYTLDYLKFDYKFSEFFFFARTKINKINQKNYIFGRIKVAKRYLLFIIFCISRARKYYFVQKFCSVAKLVLSFLAQKSETEN